MPDKVIWPTIDPAQRMASIKQRDEEGRRQYLIGISKDRAQYKKLLIAAGIMEEPKMKHIGYKAWSIDEENLAEDTNNGLSDMGSSCT